MNDRDLLGELVILVHHRGNNCTRVEERLIGLKLRSIAYSYLFYGLQGESAVGDDAVVCCGANWL
jgi:hypothetical protein